MQRRKRYRGSGRQCENGKRMPSFRIRAPRQMVPIATITRRSGRGLNKFGLIPFGRGRVFLGGDDMNDHVKGARQLAEKLLKEFTIGHFEDATLKSFEEVSPDELATGIDRALVELRLELREK